jgi:hypothetical protein
VHLANIGSQGALPGTSILAGEGRHSVLSKLQEPLAPYATLALRTPSSATPLLNLKTPTPDKCLPANFDHVTMSLVLECPK